MRVEISVVIRLALAAVIVGLVPNFVLTVLASEQSTSATTLASAVVCVCSGQGLGAMLSCLGFFKVRVIRMLLAGSIFLVASVLLQAYFLSGTWGALFRISEGIGSGFVYAWAFVVLSSASSQVQRNRISGVFSASTMTGVSTGPFLASVLLSFLPNVAMVFLVLIGLVSLALALSSTIRVDQSRSTDISISQIIWPVTFCAFSALFVIFISSISLNVVPIIWFVLAFVSALCSVSLIPQRKVAFPIFVRGASGGLWLGFLPVYSFLSDVTFELLITAGIIGYIIGSVLSASLFTRTIKGIFIAVSSLSLLAFVLAVASNSILALLVLGSCVGLTTSRLNAVIATNARAGSVTTSSMLCCEGAFALSVLLTCWSLSL